MELAFTKLFNKIVTSSVWSEDDKTRIMWITLLAISDRHGYVAAALPGLADVARMSLEEAKKAIHNLESKDEYSRNKILDGRRIVPVEGGWEIVTYESHRKLLSKEERKAYKAEWIARKRRQERRQKSTTVDSESTLSTQAEAEAEADKSTPLAPLKGGTAPKILTDAVTARFRQWIKYRKENGKKVKDWNSFFLDQARWLAKTFTETDQMEVLEQSMRNGWIGLFEPKRVKDKRLTQNDVERETRREREMREAQENYDKTRENPKNHTAM